MNSPNTTFLELLQILNCELWSVKLGSSTIEAKGFLQVLHSQTFNLFLLQLGSVRLPLEKSLPVIGAFSGKEKYPTYLIPSFEGYYMLKVVDPNPGVALRNFETILENTCKFVKKYGLEPRLDSIKESKAGSALGAIKEGLHKVSEKLSNVMITKNTAHPNVTMLRPFEDLQKVDSHGVTVVDVPKSEVNSMKKEYGQFSSMLDKNLLWKEFNDFESTKPKPSDNVPDLMNMYADLSSDKASTGPHTMTDEKIEHTEGASNIPSVKDPVAMDNQEVVGKENQRLPAYEIQHTKEEVKQGLNRASAHIDEGTHLDFRNFNTREEDETFTTGLLSGKMLDVNLVSYFEQPFSSLDVGGDMSSKPLDPLKTEFPSDLMNDASQKSTKIDKTTEDPLASVPKELFSQISSTATQGSNISEVSEGFESDPAPPNLSQGLLGNKTNNLTQEIPSEKLDAKKKSASLQPPNKENVGINSV